MDDIPLRLWEAVLGRSAARHFVSIGGPHTALASVVAVLKALDEQMVLGGSTNKEQMASAESVPDGHPRSETHAASMASGSMG